MYYLYQLTFLSGKIYIGQTVRSMNVRMAQHRTAAKRGSNLPVHNAWRKYGEPSVSILLECDCIDQLHRAEIDAIRDLQSRIPNGYNIGFGGETAPSKSPEVAAKISAKGKGRKIQDTSAISEGVRLNWQNPEYRQKVSDGLKASWGDERRQETSIKFKKMWARRHSDGWTMPDSTKEKLSRKPISDETKAKMSASAKARKDRKHSPETRAKIAAATKKAWQDEDITERRVSAIRQAKAKKGVS
ncbi:grpIintron_endo, group I intron endonuclease [uncultured Caudovirales phage]|uniref:GrpIintron_endo, group I intron endonuclease n=1 Tax=uncultured Caudovirales phage TaxID=2100421 RepID=A0A6J7XCC0_9CAUD|nr:grpIintron_endo, group I intron endonuclease [uncultured Caudovirales phage]